MNFHLCDRRRWRPFWTLDAVYGTMWVKRFVPETDPQEMLLKPTNSKKVMKQTQTKDPLKTNDDDDPSISHDINDHSIFLIAQLNGDITSLEAHVYYKNLIQHCFHLPIAPQPTCMEWFNCYPDEPIHCCAIGSREPEIEIWNLSLMNIMQPFFKLGRKANVSKRQEHIGHKEMIVDLAWNQNLPHILASSSKDATILLWNLDIARPIEMYNSTDREAFSLKWNPHETHSLLIGCLDKKVRLRDYNRERRVVKTWDVQGIPKKVLWNPHNTNYCIANVEGDYISYLDVRADKPVWEIKRRESYSYNNLILSTSYPGLLITASDDGLISIWDIINHEPMLVWEERDPSEKINIAMNPHNELILGVCSMKRSHESVGKVYTDILDFSVIPEVRGRFADRFVS